MLVDNKTDATPLAAASSSESSRGFSPHPQYQSISKYCSDRRISESAESMKSANPCIIIGAVNNSPLIGPEIAAVVCNTAGYGRVNRNQNQVVYMSNLQHVVHWVFIECHSFKNNRSKVSLSTMTPQSRFPIPSLGRDDDFQFLN